MAGAAHAVAIHAVCGTACGDAAVLVFVRLSVSSKSSSTSMALALAAARALAQKHHWCPSETAYAACLPPSLSVSRPVSAALVVLDNESGMSCKYMYCNKRYVSNKGDGQESINSGALHAIKIESSTITCFAG